MEPIEPLFALRNVTKVFPGVKALDDVRLELFPGQVTALVGENGAGKSTLVKTMTGIYQPEAGEIWYDGAPVSMRNPEDARQMGITAIHQETVLFDDMTVAENIFAGSYLTKGRFGNLDWAGMNRRAEEILREIEAPLSPRALLKGLSIGQKHMVAIARALSVKARVVILDEPTAALSHHEIQELYGIVRRLRDAGTAIMFITHKFDEIFAVADRYTVFRDGRFVGDGLIKDVTEPELVEMMVARSVNQTFPKVDAKIGAEVFRADNLSHPTEFDNISFSVAKGEILGFYGLVGAGRTEVMKALFGLSKEANGTLFLNNEELTVHSPADAIDA
ncbi:MAG: sugar ABC transporter ATP-binding protein, partial [Natronospirillum sp.]